MPSVHFDGSTSYYTTSSGPPKNNNLTYCCFFNCGGGVASSPVILDISNGSDGNEITMNPGGPTGNQVIWISSAASGGASTGFFTVNLNQWYFVAATYNNTSLTLYFKPVGAPCLQRSAFTVTDSFTPVNIGIGVEAPTGGQPFQGGIASVRVWNAVLTQAELDAEAGSMWPVRQAALWDWWLLESLGDLRGRGEARTTITKTGTPTLVNGPNVNEFAPNILAGRFATFPSSSSAGVTTLEQDDPPRRMVAARPRVEMQEAWQPESTAQAPPPTPPFGGCAYEC